MIAIKRREHFDRVARMSQIRHFDLLEPEDEISLDDDTVDARLKIDFDDLAREQYTRAFDQYAADLQQLALRNDGRYVGISTRVAIEDVIFGSLVRARGIA